ncbi:hypothetical protein VZC37_04025 [Gordonia sp. LSe1-13]|uniref:Uncharacterized protein n=1 Tax=Gordonia sesuvii TaxID=3116777 RepID=A0ABU7M8P7_9ACTN|nr:hypothetical protein [Gordonia sp. LSe1-13]
MAAGPVNSTGTRIPGVREVTRARAVARRRPLRYRLAVIAADPLEAIEYAGGLLFDQSMAGWDVSVHVAEGGDTRPLEILGAPLFDLSSSLSSRDSLDHRTIGPWPQAVVVSGKVFAAEERLRSATMVSIDQHLLDVKLWGDDLPSELDHRCLPMSHRLSVAAKAFKRRAFAAAHIDPATVTNVESFRSAADQATTPPNIDLVPAS